MTVVPAVDLWIDLVCPWCRLNHELLNRARTELATEGVVIDVIYRPFQLAPGQQAGITRREHFTKAFGNMAQADAAFERVRAIGATEGVQFRFDLIEIEPNTLDAHRLVSYAQQIDHAHSGAYAGPTATDVAAAVYEAFFVEGQDIGDVETLIEIGTAAGLDRKPLADHLRSTEGVVTVQQEANRARQLGVRGIPTYGLAGRPASLSRDGLSLTEFLRALVGSTQSSASWNS